MVELCRRPGGRLLRYFNLITLLLCLATSPRAELLINEYLSANVDGLIDFQGDHEDWLELLNTGPDPVNLSGFFLSDEADEPYLWPLPDQDLAAGETLLIFASGQDLYLAELHSNFKLSSDGGEDLLISDSLAQPVDVVVTVDLPSDISHGREPEGGDLWLYYVSPSPGDQNPPGGGQGIPEPPIFSPDGGFHPGPLQVTLFHPHPDSEIRYTLDGSPPGPDSPLSTGQVAMDGTLVLRARAMVPDQIPGRITTRGFMIDDPTELPVLFLSTDPPHLWDWETGIHVMGPDAEAGFPYFGANFWQNWERPVHADFYEADGTSAIRFDAGLKIHGGRSRAFPQKSLRLTARDRYGQDEFEHAFFPRRQTDAFKALVLHNAGQDWKWAAMRDPLSHLLAAELDIEWADSRPTRVYLNGDYWGFLYFREHQDKHYFPANCDADEDDIDFLENRAVVIEGDTQHYLALREFLETSDLSDTLLAAQLPEWLDLDEHATYTALQVWFGNIDWPGNNRRYWRPREADGIWRWLLHDLDYGLGASSGADHATLQGILQTDGDFPWGPYETMVFRQLLNCEDYRGRFLGILQELMNATLATDRVNQALEAQVDKLEAEVPRHREHWDLAYAGVWPDHIETIRDFATQRSPILRQQVMSTFGLVDTLLFDLDIQPPAAGSIGLRAIQVDSTWQALFFAGVPVLLEAHPAPGWTFGHWSGGDLADEALVTLTPEDDLAITAHFVPGPPLLINEVNYHSADDFDAGDWVELHSRALAPLDIAGYVFKDENDEHTFVIPPGTVIPPGGFLVICRDRERFAEFFPEAPPVLGDFDFGLSNGGENLRLFDSWGNLMDALSYDDVPPWPTEPDGEGPTLELMFPEGDNADPANWAASLSHGTPGEANSRLGGVAVPDGGIPVATGILGVWPNPFNPTVSLEIVIGKTGRARLTVHDIRGREMARLVDGELGGGRHDYTWRAAGLASGVYLLRLESAGKVDTRKLILLR